MARHAAILAIGVVAGIMLMLVLGRPGPPAVPVDRGAAAVPKGTPAAAQPLRTEQYANLASVADVVALPSEFARAEAMHVLAGRAGAAEAQDLVFEADRIGDGALRITLLEILFSRLTEIDPRSALALAREDAFRATPSIEETVWRTWARNDLDAALFAAKTQTSVLQQHRAAQNLFAAFGYMGNATTERIETELGIGPDRTTRTQYLHSIADRSIAEAIAYINGIEDDVERREYVATLAGYLGSRDPHEMLAYADRLTDTTDQVQFARPLQAEIARRNPREILDRFLAGDGLGSIRFSVAHAARALANTDPDVAKQYFDESTDPEFRRVMGSAIAAELARSDPAAALAWARDNDTGGFSMMQHAVLQELARNDPKTALAAALTTPNAQQRSMLLSNLVANLAHGNPAQVAVYIAEIEDPRLRADASATLASAWMATDPDAALDWALGLDNATRSQVVAASAEQLLHRDIDAAMRLLPQMDQETQQALRHQIADRLASTRSPADALAFIRQFEGEPDFEQMQISVISGVARRDVTLATQLVAQLGDDRARDNAYMRIIGQHARSDPAEASQWLGNISDERLRGAARMDLVQAWSSSDPEAATAWVTRLPDGPARDDALLSLVVGVGQPAARLEGLIAEIQDPGKRQQAEINVILNLANSNRSLAREMLRNSNLPEERRRQIESILRSPAFSR